MLRGVLTELQELKAGQQRASLEDTRVRATCTSGRSTTLPGDTQAL